MKGEIKKKDLSLGIIILSIFLIIFGVSSLLIFFTGPATIWDLFWGILNITSGIALLLQKFWALRLVQALFILSVITSPLILIGAPEIPFIVKIVSLIVVDGILVLLLWYCTYRGNILLNNSLKLQLVKFEHSKKN